MLLAYMFFCLFFVLIISIIVYTRTHAQFGGKITPLEISRFSRSKQWNGKIFLNRVPVNMSMRPLKVVHIMVQSFKYRKVRMPKSLILVKPFKETCFLENDKAKFIWYGHSVILLRLSGKNILIDPMFGGNASPIAPFKTKRFSENTLAIIDQLPYIDMVCISHDHYDHLDYDSIKKLKSKTKHFYVALGVGRHLKRWGVKESKITEFDWNDEVKISDIKLIFTETQHFAGRGLSDRFKSLWGGWIVQSDSKNIYWSGDSGYNRHFKEIGEKYGPFDIGFMECGQYNENWSEIHMNPEESVQAAKDAKVILALPVHNNAFALAMHTSSDPVDRFTAEAKLKSQSMIYPGLGEIVEI